MRVASTRRGSFFAVAVEVEGEQVFEDLVVGEIGGPAVGVGDGVIEVGVGVGQPSGVGVVEAGEGSLGVGVAPVFAELV